MVVGIPLSLSRHHHCYCLPEQNVTIFYCLVSIFSRGVSVAVVGVRARRHYSSTLVTTKQC